MIESELILSCDKKFVNFATFQILILQPNKNATNRNFGEKTRLTGCKTLFLQHRQNRSGKAMTSDQAVILPTYNTLVLA